jgi:hypothetical protein
VKQSGRESGQKQGARKRNGDTRQIRWRHTWGGSRWGCCGERLLGGGQSHDRGPLSEGAGAWSVFEPGLL